MLHALGQLLDERVHHVAARVRRFLAASQGLLARDQVVLRYDHFWRTGRYTIALARRAPTAEGFDIAGLVSNSSCIAAPQRTDPIIRPTARGCVIFATFKTFFTKAPV